MPKYSRALSIDCCCLLASETRKLLAALRFVRTTYDV